MVLLQERGEYDPLAPSQSTCDWKEGLSVGRIRKANSRCSFGEQIDTKFSRILKCIFSKKNKESEQKVIVFLM